MLAQVDIVDIERQLRALRDQWRVLFREYEELESAPLSGDPEDERREAERLIDLEEDMLRLSRQGDRLIDLLPAHEKDRMWDLDLDPEMWE